MRDTGTWYCTGLTTVGDTVGGCGWGGGGEGKGVGNHIKSWGQGWLWVGLEDTSGTTPPPLPSSIKIPGCAPELVSCLKTDEWKF